MNTKAAPKRRFMTALYDIVGDHEKRMTPFGEVSQQAQLTDSESHEAFALLKEEGFVRSSRDGCVALTDAGRTYVHAPVPRKPKKETAAAGSAAS